MADVISSVSTAISLVARLRTATVPDAEYKNLVADLSAALADVKLKLADLIDENRQLKRRIEDARLAKGQPCPKCHERTWELVDSGPNKHLGDLGVIQRTYKCSLCGFSEATVVTPK